VETLLGVVLAILGITVLSLVLTLVLVLVGVRGLHRRNQVSPDHAGDAPLKWLWSPAGAARLHRRLRAAISVTRVVRTRHARDADPPRAVDLAREVEIEAATLDRQLTLIGRLHVGERRRLMPQLAAEVRRVEQVASRLSMLDVDAAAAVRLPQERSAMEDLAERLDQLEESHRELRVTDAEVGLRRDPPILASAPLPSRIRRQARG